MGLTNVCRNCGKRYINGFGCGSFCSSACEKKYKNKKTVNFLKGVETFLEVITEEAKKYN